MPNAVSLIRQNIISHISLKFISFSGKFRTKFYFTMKKILFFEEKTDSHSGHSHLTLHTRILAVIDAKNGLARYFR